MAVLYNHPRRHGVGWAGFARCESDHSSRDGALDEQPFQLCAVNAPGSTTKSRDHVTSCDQPSKKSGAGFRVREIQKPEKSLSKA